MLYYLSIGVLFGLTAGFSPGPLLALVVSETLEHGIGSGVKVALAPIITDVPIIAITLFTFTQLSSIDNILGMISLIGGCYVLYMAYENVRPKEHENKQIETKPRSLSKGVLVNALSPHPYLFWFSVGAPTVNKALSVDTVAPVLFIGGFYSFLIGAKIFLAFLVGKSKSFLNEKAYIYTMKILGVMLGIFSVVLFADGLKLLGVLNSH